MNMNRSVPNRRSFLAGIAVTSAGAIVACAPETPVDARNLGDPAALDLATASRLIQTGALSPIDATKACLARIARLNPVLNAFITVTADSALAEAKTAALEIAAGNWRGPLHGVPIALKDNIDTAGVLTTAGSAVFADRIPTADAEVVRRLKAAGAVFLGKLNLHEFGNGATGAISHYGPVHNPWDQKRISGGSSGGSAAAVAAGLCYGALGTDTGGSIRIPASICGVVGLKPTYGLVSNLGVIPLSPTYDHVGPICRSARDASLMLAAISDYDDGAQPDARVLKVGILKDEPRYCDFAIPAAVRAVFEEAIATIETCVGAVVPADFPALPPDHIIEVEAYNWHRDRIASSRALYDPRTLADLLGGADIQLAQLARERAALASHRSAVAAAFDGFDVVIIPTMLEPPTRIDETRDAFDSGAACTTVFNASGLPAMTIPCGVFPDGMPMGLTVAGPPRSEASIISLAEAYEALAPWSRRRLAI